MSVSTVLYLSFQGFLKHLNGLIQSWMYRDYCVLTEKYSILLMYLFLSVFLVATEKI